ncbi:MAG TPA: membrane protein insertion efficiency factor YidD [Planctomycetota bacterium]|nr:membrane protein insertion efficiency factor YidD [Planctomycetota bacterium]
MRRVLLAMIAMYQAALSPLLPAACRFSPTCSRYAAEAIRRHGCRRGLRLTASRLARCRPGGGGGEDPVP